jgi:DNA-directed RNA polymerase subunit RPC12/RpoP
LRKINLDKLPHNGKLIDWIHSVGYELDFVYDDIIGKIKIINYQSKIQKVTLQYNNNILDVPTSQLYYGGIGQLLKVNGKKRNYKYKIGDIVFTNKGIIKILDLIRLTSAKKYTQKGYKYICLKDNYVGTIAEGNLLNGQGCPVCSGKRIVVKGINDMWTTNPNLAKLLANPEDGYKYSQGSDKKVDWKCPECGNIIKNKLISQIKLQGLSCPKCSDGISYPEKFMYNLLQQLNVDFEYQKKFDWCKYELNGKQKYGIYDFYIPSKQIIIEMDGGLGHGKRMIGNYKKEETVLIDHIKDQLAKEHEIKPIRIDCDYEKESQFLYIKKNILKSKLYKLYVFKNIDWNLINIECQKSIIYKVCTYKKNHSNETTTEIAKKFKLHQCTIIDYLKRGNKNGWCVYNAKEEMHRVLKMNAINHGKKCCKKVICITTNTIYHSEIEASKSTGVYFSNIGACCNHRYGYKTSGKLKWMFLDEFMRQNNYTDIYQIPNVVIYNNN